MNTSKAASSGPDLKKFKHAVEFRLVTQDFQWKVWTIDIFLFLKRIEMVLLIANLLQILVSKNNSGEIYMPAVGIQVAGELETTVCDFSLNYF